MPRGVIMNLNLSLYKQTDLEKWINKLYRDNGMHYASDMDIDVIASIFDVEVYTYEGKCLADWEDHPDGYSNAIILLHAYLTEQEKRERFFHELCHPLKHIGSQDQIPTLLRELQEIQAAHFQLYAAIPIYMLEEFNGMSSRQVYIEAISLEFKLPTRFVEKRVNQIERRIKQEIDHQNFIAMITPVQIKGEYMPETIRLLKKLEVLKNKKKLV